MADKATLDNLLNGQKKQLSPIDKFIEAQRMQQETEFAKALGGGSYKSRDENDGEDLAEKEIAKALRDLRLQNTMKLLKGTDEAPKQDNALLSRIAELEHKLEDAERRREREEQDRKWEDRFNKLETLFLTSKPKEETSGTDKILAEMRQQREEERRERERIERENEKDDRIQTQLDQMEDRMADQISRLTADQRTGKPTDQLKQQLKDLQDTMDIYDQIRGNSPMKEERLSAAELVDTILDKGDKVVKAGRSIYDQMRGDKDLEEEIPPYEAPTEEYRPRMMSKDAILDPELAEYIKRGKEIDDPQNPGNKVWIGLYGDAYDAPDGKGMTKDQIELRAKTEPEKFKKDIFAAKEVYEQMRAQYEPPEQPKENKAPAGIFPPQANNQDENQEDPEQESLAQDGDTGEEQGEQGNAE